MKNTLGLIAAVLAMCCLLVAGPASQARAADECTTQGALALALADVLGIKVTTAQDAASALALRGIEPKQGWNIEACLTDEVRQEVKMAFANAGDFERAQTLIAPNPARSYVSPSKP